MGYGINHDNVQVVDIDLPHAIRFKCPLCPACYVISKDEPFYIGEELICPLCGGITHLERIIKP